MTYILTFGELVDRLSIAILKRIRIPEHRKGFDEEIEMLISEIPHGKIVYNAMLTALVNEAIWSNESMVRDGKEQDLHLLLRTHSLNGVRSRVKNSINALYGQRQDPKVDCLAEREMDEWPNPQT